jgi:hypothetical protein
MDWERVCLSTEKIDREAALRYARSLYINLYQMEEPAYVFVESPLDLVVKAARLNKVAQSTFSYVPICVAEYSNGKKKNVNISTWYQPYRGVVLGKIEKGGHFQQWDMYNHDPGMPTKIRELVNGVNAYFGELTNLSKESPRHWNALKRTECDRHWRNAVDVVWWHSNRTFASWISPLYATYRYFYRRPCSLVEYKAALSAFAVLTYKSHCFIMERPAAIHWEGDRLHAFPEPAIEWRDGTGIYAIDGVVHRRVPGKLTADKIQNTNNLEIRRVLREQYGTEKWIKEIGGRIIHEDVYGRLWEAGTEGFETVKFVELKNSTPEPDGTYKLYYLRVPGFIHTARRAVAWSFQVQEEEYAPLVET